MDNIKKMEGFSVLVITNPGDRLVTVIKHVREKTGWGLKKVVALIKTPPTKLPPMPQEEAEGFKGVLEKAGASVTIQ